ncbi:hypothetical protein K469DRAFT_746269 [Zopfia rhizophila CBS 207.26]|uniref:NmrA-like domain-containing protein n=1 Tax=Zopfia rhizophila CBS 207.26 TaxID=1314779 RepID=A0A6A6EL37_9PEZI|nr:hypothetical protein K469DRAFT_746269 [Zopfia rhizophila CBS 207.26]
MTRHLTQTIYLCLVGPTLVSEVASSGSSLPTRSPLCLAAPQGDRPRRRRRPPVGGIHGTSTTITQLIRFREEVLGGNFEVERLKGEDIKKGELKASWMPLMTHLAIKTEREKFSRVSVVMVLVWILKGAWNLSDEWNRTLPDYKLTSADEYLREAWKGKP